MTEVAVSRTIAAPPERVWSVLTDLENAPRHVSAIQNVEVLTPGPFGVGTRWRETRTMFGRAATEEMTITTSEPPSRYVAEADSAGTHYVTEFALAPAGAGGTQATMTFRGEPRGPLAKIASVTIGWMMRGSMAKAMRKDIDELAQVCEQGGDGQTA
jgi:carbon monoxide dehydrogenase subunit G